LSNSADMRSSETHGKNYCLCILVFLDVLDHDSKINIQVLFSVGQLFLRVRIAGRLQWFHWLSTGAPSIGLDEKCHRSLWSRDLSWSLLFTLVESCEEKPWVRVYRTSSICPDNFAFPDHSALLSSSKFVCAAPISFQGQW